ncbi:MAG: Asp-tRNA(Asn)/Glu-tRNA(Gln) amidotransferase subunit GatB [Granulosicoccus sp.]|nr:Asp-tRNA(Asn)/Glu-tRNA(Gln) amidotransferase subunit GatB [Granulosicoccus sp.]
MTWETVIGLEIHAQLATRSKIFSASSTAFGAEPNTQASAVDLGLPGVLPVVNRDVVRMAVRFALATDASITRRSVFARKNYFYPDLPKGYQISQMAFPIVGPGRISLTLPDGEEKIIGLTRAHLEEDAGKSVHDLFDGYTGIDLNRAGTPLLEIVSEPDMRSAAEAVAYARYMHSLVRYIDICDGNMQEGSFRCDANVSIRQSGSNTLGTRTEIKNLNSFRFLERAIEFEIERQIDIVESGATVVQETRLYDADRDETRSMRSKEEANDYRYFPDPDLPPLVIDDDFIDAVRSTMPELPAARRARFVEQLALPPADAQALCADRQTADYFEAVFENHSFAPRLAANWVLGELFARMNKENIPLAASPVSSAQLGRLIERVDDGTLSGKLGKQVFDALWSGEQDVDAIIDSRGLKQISDTGAIDTMIDAVMADNPTQVAEYRAGKEKLLSFFVGAVMKASRGKANPAQLNQLLRERLKG